MLDSIISFVKENFLADMVGLPFQTLAENLGLSALCAIGILAIFHLTRGKTTVNRNFAFTLVMLPPVACMVSMIVTNAFVVAVGMVGALSIIRFRHIVRESKDLAIVFWSVSAGIGCGVTQVRRIVIPACVIIAALALAVRLLQGRGCFGTLSVKTSGSVLDIEDILRESTLKYNLKYKSIGDTSELFYEVKHRKRGVIDHAVFERLSSLEAVSSVRFIEM
jgi:hypothetical protein